jgi:hypothetical protein
MPFRPYQFPSTPIHPMLSEFLLIAVSLVVAFLFCSFPADPALWRTLQCVDIACVLLRMFVWRMLDHTQGSRRRFWHREGDGGRRHTAGRVRLAIACSQAYVPNWRRLCGAIVERERKLPVFGAFLGLFCGTLSGLKFVA